MPMPAGLGVAVTVRSRFSVGPKRVMKSSLSPLKLVPDGIGVLCVGKSLENVSPTR